MKRTGAFILIFFLLLTASNVSAQSAAITNGLNYLYSIQNPDGSWGNVTSSTELVPATSSVIVAMRALNATSTQNYIDAVSWLQGQSFNTTEFFAERINTLSVPGTDQDSLLSYLDSIYTDAWGGYGDYESNNLDTAAALLALKTVNYPDLDTIGFALSYLMDNQNADGGFGFYPGDDSNVYMTSLILQVFSRYGEIFYLQAETNDSAAYLLSNQNPDGGFGPSTSAGSTVYETALTVSALIETGQVSEVPLQNAISYLVSNQLLNGSWEDDPYTTAIALKALSKVKPNLNISQSDIAFSNSVPTIGETVSITAVINNDGLLNADNVLVRFYNGDPALGGVLIGETTVVQAASSGSVPASVDWIPSEYADTQIYVSIDPLNTINELNETDNIANNNIYVGTGPNLTVSNITLLPEPAILNQPVNISFTINNIGETTANNILVEYYKAETTQADVYFGKPDPSQYVKVGETTIPELLPGGTDNIQITETFITSFHNIKVVVDPLNAILETDESDNQDSKWITALPEQTDLIINSNLVITPKNPKANDDITIFAQAYNYGSIAAYSVSAAVFDGDPNAGGVQIGEQIIDMLPLDYKQLEFHVTLAQGVHDIYLVLDRANAVAEADETNNQAVKSVTVDMASNVDFSIAASDIAFNPVQPLPGDIITITATIHNLGTQSEVTSASFYIGNPSYGGTKIQDTTVTVPGNGTAATSINYIVDGSPATIFVVIDEDDAIYEQKEDNNMAFNKLSVGMPDLLVRDKDIKINRMSDGSIYVSPLIRNLGGMDASNVSVSIFNGDPASGGALISNQTIALISAASGRRINVPYTLLQGKNNLYVIADPDDQLQEISEQNNTGTKVLFGTDPNGPDISVTNIDSTGIATDTQMLTVAGSLVATLENSGVIDVAMPFTLTAYEDLNKNSLFDDGIDNKLGETVFSSGLAASGTGSVSISISGQVNFRDNHIHVMADSGNEIYESNEENNDRHHKEDCLATPVPIANSQVIEKWTWTGSDFEPAKNQVRMSPVVANMNDDNGDGIIDENDVPDIVFLSVGGPTSNFNQGVLRVIDGRDGSDIMNVVNPDGLYSLGDIAVGDIDNDGDPEIIALKSTGYRPVAYNHDGSILWTGNAGVSNGFASPTIADINLDGNPEILVGTSVFNNNGEFIWLKTNYQSSVSIAADLDDNDLMEVINSAFAYNPDGSTHWFASTIGSYGFNAIGNFDADTSPEVVFSGNGRVFLLEHDKTVKWSFKDTTNYRYEMESSPAVGDVDGDGMPEIATSGMTKLLLFNNDGTIRWEGAVSDYTGGKITPLFIDLNGDRKDEVAVNDGDNYFIFDGDTGAVLYSTPNPSGTSYEVPAAADVDSDGETELIVFGGQHAWNNPYYGGIRVFADQNGSWVNSKRVWNQHSYHVTNIDEDGYIPLREENSWEKVNCYRCNVPLDNALDTPDLTASRIMVDKTGYPESVSIAARIGNAGTLLEKEGATVSFYNGDPSSGGALLGSVLTSKPLNPGEYEDLSFTWHYPPAGTYDIYVVVDEANTIKECDEQNNSANTQMVLGGSSYPDLAVTSSDVATSSPLVEGQPATISATVNNIGSLASSDVEVSFYDGDPANNGVLIDSVIVAGIDVGLSALAEVSWDTMGQSGVNFIHVKVDPLNSIVEGNENNNSTLIQANVQPPTWPDLAISSGDIVLSSQNPTEGDAFTLTATIHNNGTDTGNVKVALYDGNPQGSGSLLQTYTILPIIPFGSQSQVNFDIATVGEAGSHDYYIAVDTDNTITEENETNNSSYRNIVINSVGLNLSASADKSQYVENEDVLVSVDVAELQNTSRTLSADVKVIDPSGALAGTVPAQSLILAPLGSATFKNL